MPCYVVYTCDGILEVRAIGDVDKLARSESSCALRREVDGVHVEHLRWCHVAAEQTPPLANHNTAVGGDRSVRQEIIEVKLGVRGLRKKRPTFKLSGELLH